MARMIVVAEDRFDELFKRTLEKLRLEHFADPPARNFTRTPEQIRLTEEMHALFHYEVCCLGNELKRA